ncbi:hypothetical protein MYCTH_95811 [Thermothelomyces thermophilus ATCC 42464]|uniref:non-specific serine/threonine protein kinase n=1 Tax=Thermothelomyces thermophilus (strain ATCC 42464 / BCRC 31852 / DSM 1799) TaxID=573729 RepID=G2QKG9_THET4|nr:uncharacterized protein MYCTH_95811 [Thermothelomyces thermophilus ATCC 42464]AEO60075.1 hypothetical protein MYCTH_95811 [Thermothelomyces thermophilus ATCC 42464]
MATYVDRVLKQDILLSLDPGRDDCLYRVRRISSGVNRVVYVTITNLNIIPEEKRTYGPSVIKELSKLSEWSGDWTTLRVYMDGDRIRCETDAFQPHALPEEHVLERYPKYDIFSFDVRRSVNHRVSEVVYGGRTAFLKIARFPFELPLLIREVEAYHRLAESDVAPKLIGYVFEESPDRVVGFLVESVEGRVANVADFEECSKALEKLHNLVVHGDLCRYNIIITTNGPKFIDFEHSTPITEAENGLVDDEKQSLAEKLVDESGAGRPWDMN